jgi:predicted ATPase/DNA-binding SARP family transcriptional activator
MIEFRVLGPIEVVRDGNLVGLGGPRQRVLLALLLVSAPRPVPIDRLADELWHGEPPDGASTTMRAYVSKLRTVLGGDAPITSSNAGYALDVEGDHVDATRFERLAIEGREALERGGTRRAAMRLRRALELWRGHPFAGVSDEGALRMEAQRLEDLRLSAFEDRIEADLALGRDAELVDELEGLVRDHPYRERLWRQLMLALYRAERQTDALAAYRRARALLDEELGLEPGEELQRLEQAILRHEVPAARPPEERHNLPAPVSSFVGRETELADIDRLLTTGRLLTLSGVGGVGKTRLALEAARRAIGESPDGVFLVDLSALTEPVLVARQVATALDIREQPDAPLAEQLLARLRDADLLIVLDNCEHMREVCAELCGRLLGSCPRLRVLATSRAALGVPGEVDYPVPPLPVPSPAADPDELHASEAVRLFLARASDVQPRRSETPEAFATAARICRDLDGLPLAIELAAARAKAFSFEEIARRLDDRFQFLVSWRRLAPARHRTLRAAMDWSYELLSDDERALLDRLSVFAGGVTLAAAAAVCLDGLDARAVDLVGRLVEASLIVPEERDGETRYRLLETVRQYAAERLESRGETAAVRRRHADQFLTLAESVQTRGAGQSQGLTQIDADLDNIRAALEFAVASGDADKELRLVAALWPYWHVRGHLAEGRDRLEAAIARENAAASGAYTRAAFGAGILAWSIGDYSRTRAIAKELLKAAKATASRSDEHAAYKLLSHVALRERKFAAAERYSKRTLELARRFDSDHDVSTAQLNLAVVYLDWGKTEAAIPMLEDVLAYNQRNGIVEGAGFALLNLGEADYHLGDYARARARFEEARKAFASVGFKAHVGHALTGLAGVQASSGHHEEAARLLGRADALLAEVGTSKDDFDPTLAAKVEAEARAHLGEDGFVAAYEHGRRSESVPRRSL